MKKLISSSLVVMMLFVGGMAYADDAVTVSQVPGTFEKYVADPVRWTVGAAWGLTKLLFKVGQAPVDKTFSIIGNLIGMEPNEALWS